MVWGVSLPWSLTVCAALGLWLMAAPAVLGAAGGAAASDHLAGPLVTTFAVVALAEVGRPVRSLNLPLGAWVAAAPWVLGGASGASALNAAAVGAAVWN